MTQNPPFPSPDELKAKLSEFMKTNFGDKVAFTTYTEPETAEAPAEEKPRAISDEQSGQFDTAEDLAANVQQQMPLYFHRWEGHEEAGRELAADFTQAEPLQHFNEHEWPTFDLRPDLRSIRVPTLVVTGDYVRSRVAELVRNADLSRFIWL